MSTSSLKNNITDILETAFPRNQYAYLILLVPALFLIFLLFASLSIIVIYSFLSHAPPTGGESITIENYVGIFSEDFYFSKFVFSLKVALEVTFLCLIISYPIAYWLATLESEYKNVFMLLIILPFWINLVVRTYSWQLMLGQEGVIEFIVSDIFGLTDSLNLLYTEGAIVIGSVHVLLPYTVLPLYASLNNIDQSLIEGAKNLGANNRRTFYEIVFPLSLPGLVAGAVLVFVLQFGAFLTPLLLGGTGNLMIGNIVAMLFGEMNAWALGSAASVIFVFIVLSSLYIFNRLIGLENLFEGAQE